MAQQDSAHPGSGPNSVSAAAIRAQVLVRTAFRLNAQLDLKSILAIVCQETAGALHATGAWINLYDASRDVFQLAASYGMPDAFDGQYQSPTREGYERFAILSRSPRVTADIQALPAITNARLYADLNVRTIAIVSLMRGQEPVGALSVPTFDRVREYTLDELAMLEGLADQATQAITNARLYANVRAYADDLDRRVRERTAALQSANDDLETANRELRAAADHSRQADRQIHLQLAALESAADAIAVTDRTGAIVWTNAAFSQLTGYSREEAIGVNPRVLKSGKQDASFYRELWECILSGHVWRGEMINRRKDGRLYNEAMTITPVRETDGEITHFIAVKQDITLRTETERAVRESEERFRRIFEEGPLGMVVADLDRRLTQVNLRMCEMLGYAEAELIGRPLVEITHPDDVAKERDLAKRLVGGEIPYLRLEKRYVRRHGEAIWAELTESLIRDDGGAPLYYLGMIEDISERKRSEHAIQTLNRELALRADDLDAANRELEAFSYSVAHDLRTPLSAIEGLCAVLLQEQSSKLDESGLRFLQLVHANAQYTSQLVLGLLAFSRSGRQELRKQVIDTEALVRQVLASLGAEQVGRDVDLAVGRLPACRGDPLLLRQVWINLLSNAFKYTRSRSRACITIGCHEDDGEQVYFVRDNGVGFDPEQSDQLFGVFQRLHDAEEYEGVGVGLAIARRIIHRHGGRIWADAKLDEGATFSFTLGGGHDR